MASPDNPVPTSPTTPNENDESSREKSPEHSQQASREGSRPPKKKHNVRFTPGGESLDTANQRAVFDLRDDTNAPPKPKPLPKSATRPRSRTGTSGGIGVAPSVRRHSNEKSEDITNETARAPLPMPRPSIMRPASKGKDPEERVSRLGQEDNRNMIGGSDGSNESEEAPAKATSQTSARERAELLARKVGTHSAPVTRPPSPRRSQLPVVRSPPPSPPSDAQSDMPIDLDDIPLEKLETKRTKYGIEDTSDEEESVQENPDNKRRRNRFFRIAQRVVKHKAKAKKHKPSEVLTESPESRSGAQTPLSERDPDNYVPRPSQYREGILSSLLKLSNQEGFGSAIAHISTGSSASLHAAKRISSSQPLLRSGSDDEGSDTQSQTPKSNLGGSPVSSGTTTPKRPKWYDKSPASQSTGALSDLVSSSTVFAQPGGSKQSSIVRPKPKHRPLSHQAINTMLGKRSHKAPEEEMTIKIHLSETLQRQKYLMGMCKALMSFGAPTHRLEEYMRMSARVLEIQGQFLYIPGAMIISFDDQSTHTTEVKIVRTVQGVDLGKLRDIHDIYKEVVHDRIGIEEAIERIQSITNRPRKFGLRTIIVMYGFASASVGPFAFGARFIDLPMSFILGCILGMLQHGAAPKSELYTNVFEITAAIITSFLARALGSIRGGGLFCFSALTQSAIALILPGYTVLCASLELQSRNIVSGSVRMVYAIIYSLFLGYGITIGSSLYGAMDKNAISEVSCRTDPPIWATWVSVPLFTTCLIIINQCKWKQMPAMIIIACTGFVVNHFTALRFPTNTQISNTLGALAIGVLANLYSRIRHGVAAAAILPAIYVQVPSGLAASGSLVSGVASANSITQEFNASKANGNTTITSAVAGESNEVNSMIFNVGYSMVQISIGITVGLFLSALFVYPAGKRRSGLFSF